MSDFKKIRAGYRGLVTNESNRLDQFLLSADLDQVKAKLENFQSIQAQLLSLDEKILDSLDPAEIMGSINENSEWSEKVYLLLGRLKSHLQSHSRRSGDTSGDRPAPAPQGGIRLPKLNLPRFSGNLVDWLSFWEVFESTVHKNRTIDNVQKFYFLKGQLDGEASHLVEGFSTTEAAYDQVIQLLKESYGDIDRLKVAHMTALLNLNAPGNDSAQLSKFRSDVECHTRSLDALGLTGDEAIVIILRRKLPSTILDKVRSFELGEFKTSLNKEIINLQLLDKPGSRASGEGGTLNMAVGSGARAKTNYKSQPAKGILNCNLCNGGHRWFFCTNYKNNESRLARAGVLNLCRSCLSNKHGKDKTSKCPTTRSRPCTHCKGNHFDLLCPKAKSQESKPVEASAFNVNSTKDATILPTITIPIKTSKGDGTKSCRVLLDQGSQRTFIKRSTLDHLDHEVIGSNNLKLLGFTGAAERQDYTVARLHYTCRKIQYKLDCVVVESLPDYQSVQEVKTLEYKLRQRGIKLSDPISSQTEVDILVGADYYYQIVHPGYKQKCDTILLPTRFGYTLSGPIKSPHSDPLIDTVSVLKIGDYNSNYNLIEESNNLTRSSKFEMEDLWRLDHLGIANDELSSESKRAISDFRNSVKYESDKGQYVVKLPWKNADLKLPTNFGLALGRLRALRTKLDRTPDILVAYNKVINEYIEKDFIEEVNSDAYEKGRVHYLAHHCVYKDSKTTPIRVVYDCSAKVGQNNSLNDCLLTGPSMVTDLAQQLLRFRANRYAFTSDIEKAFLMVGLNVDDRNVTRFLWYKDIDNPNSPLITYRFKVVLFGATCSQYLLNATIELHLELMKEDTTALSRGLYIDNLQGTSDTEEGLVQLYILARKLFNLANLNLREWVTNSVSLHDRLQVDETAAPEQSYTKNLGMIWHPQADVLCYPSRSFSDNKTHTKRSFLSLVSKFFDPLGLTLPVTIRARLILQELWRRSLGWDVELPTDLQLQVHDLLSDYNILTNLRIPRMVTETGPVVLHAFCDSSATAYGVVIYFVTSLGISIVTARARVAPIKGLTIPKMELTSMLITGRLINHISSAYEKELTIKDIHIWSDSQIALSWVHSDKCLPVYVRNRVDEIRLLLPNVTYHYIDTLNNPSDLLTRGIKASRLIKSDLWWNGPSCLQHEKDWVPWHSNTPESLIIETTTVSPLQVAPPEPFIAWDNFSSYHKLVNTIAWVLRFVTNVRRKIRGENPDLGKLHNTKEYQSAEVTLIRLVQQETFHLELAYLSSDKNCKPPNLVRQLNLYLDKDLLRCEGRLKWSKVDKGAKHPILMPTSHAVTNLLVRHIHERTAHYGIHYTVSKLRLTWWIPRVRQVVRRVIKKCVTCLRLKGKPFRTGPAPPLPNFRVDFPEPFSAVGLDYTGALRTKDYEKVYILLFTCAATRAVHIELCINMTGEEFLLAFRRFCARRSYPNLIVSDNAPSFHQTANYLNDLSNDPKIKSFMSERKLTWNFIPAKAPWFGGLYERCVGIIKSGLRAVVGRAFLTLSELTTVLVEIEAIVNDRPITYVYSDVQEPLPLTPSHLLHGRPLVQFPPDPQAEGEFADPSLYTEEAITKRYRYLLTLMEGFRRRWTHEYLLALRERSNKTSNNISAPSVGDVVLIHNDSPRIYWRIGKVLKVYQGADGVERVAEVKTSTGVTIRPIAKLYSLELSSETPNCNAGPADVTIEDDRQSTSDSSPPRVGTRPRRTAGAARDMWRHKIASGQL